MGSALSVVTARVSAAHAPSDKPPWQGETPPECLKRHPGALTSGDRDFRAFGVRIRRIIKRISLAEWQNIHQLSLTSHTLTFYSQNKLKPIHFYCTTYTKGRLGLCASNPSLILFCSTIPSIHFGFELRSCGQQHLCCTLFYFYQNWINFLPEWVLPQPPSHNFVF